MDLDLLVFGRHRIEVARPPEGRSDDPAKASMPLTVPHVEARNRLFVLAPLADLAPGLVPPGWGETVATARDRRVGPRARTPPARSRAWDGEGWAPARRLEPDGGRPVAVEHVDGVDEPDLLASGRP